MTESSRLLVWSERYTRRRARSLVLCVQTSDGRDLLGKLSFDEDVTSQLIEGTGRETIPAYGERPGGVDADTFLQAILDHAWEQGFRPKGFFDTPNEIAALKAHLHDLRALAFKGEVQPKP